MFIYINIYIKHIYDLLYSKSYTDFIPGFSPSYLLCHPSTKSLSYLKNSLDIVVICNWKAKTLS